MPASISYFVTHDVADYERQYEQAERVTRELNTQIVNILPPTATAREWENEMNKRIPSESVRRLRLRVTKWSAS